MYPKRRNVDQYEDVGYEEEYEERERALPRQHSVRSGNEKSKVGTLSFIFGTALIVLTVTLYTYVFDSATVTIVPKYKAVSSLDQTFSFTKDSVTAGAGIPFTTSVVTLSKTKTLSPSESRKVEAKASGKAIIYNNYDANPQKLIKNTRFESSKGRIYRINQSIEVPGKKGSVPGSIEVTLYADSNGADYNIDQTTFSIPGFKGTPRETAFYAKTKSPITGGMSGTMSLASLSDVNAAKDALALELTKSIQSEVLKVKKEGYVPMYQATEITFDDNEQDVLKGLTTTYTVTATGHLPLAREARLADAIARTFGDYDGAPVRLINTESLSFIRKDADHLDASGTVPILVSGKPSVVWVSDADAVKELVKGKNRDDFKPLMKTVNSIESAEVSFSPVWLSHFPEELSKLSIIESLPKR
jgi:hypothetical protein